MLVELLGLPGAGKSTLLRALLPHLRGQGVKVCSAEKLEDTACADADAPRYLTSHPGRTMLYRATAFRAAHPDLLRHIETKLDMDHRQQFLFSYTTTLFQAAHEHRHKYAATFLDEGFMHRGTFAHLDADDALYARYLDLIPLPDLILNLCPPPRTAFRRAIHRRKAKPATRKKVFAKLGDQTVFRRRHRLIEMGLDALKARGAPVLDVDTSQELEACIEAVSPAILDHAQQKTAALGMSTAAE